MKVPSIIFLLFNILGIILGDVTSNYIVSLIVMLCIYVVILLFEDNERIFLYFVAILFGVYGSFMTINIKDSKNFDCYKGKNVKIIANVVSDCIRKKDLYYYEIKTKSVKFKGYRKEIKKRLLLKTDRELPDVFDKEVCLVGEIKIPKEARNFGGFNHKRYLDSRDIEGTVFCKSDVIKIGKKAYESRILNLGMKLRRKILEIIDSLLDEKEAGLLKCVLVGNKNFLEDDLTEKLRDLGLALSVSGINIAYMLLIIKFLLRKFGIRYKFINPILIFVVGFYMLIIGFTPSIMKTVVMTVLSLMGEFLFYRSRPLSNLAVAAIVVLFMNPFLIYSIGFQFSFAATFSVILFMDYVTKILEKWNLERLESLSVCLALYLGILPLEVYHFNKFSICSVVVNIILFPLHSIIIFLGTVMTIIGNFSRILAKPIAIFLEIMIKFLFILGDNIGKLTFLNIKVVNIGVLGVITYYSILVCVYFYNKFDRARTFFQKYRNVFIIVPTVIIVVSFMYPKKFRVNFMDVGQGDCALIQTIHNKNILIDGGEDIELSDIIRNNVTKIDLMIATHGHIDHIGGLIKILDNMQVDKLVVPDTKYMGEFCEMRINKNNTKLYRCKMKDSIFIDKDTKIQFLNPSKESMLNGENDNSLVVKLTHKGIKFLFTGDITNVCEKNMIDKGIDLRADILKIPHHGSITSTSEEFLNKVNPSLTIISVGEKNKFDHPSNEVLERLKNKNIKIIRTDENGQVQVMINDKKVKLRTKFR